MHKIQWRATYKDGTSIAQVDGDILYAYEDIDRANLQVFSLHNVEEDATPSRLLSIPFDNDGHKLVWRRRVYRAMGSEADQVVHIVGKKGEFILAIFADGSMVARENFVEGDLVFDHIESIKGEA